MPPLLHRQAEAGGHRWSRRAVRAPVRPPHQALTAPARTSFLQAKLAALAAAPGERGGFPGGATLLAADGSGRGWVLAEDRPHRALGGALAWARKHGVRELHVVVDDADAAGVLARRAACFAEPALRVWRVEGTALAPAPAAPLVVQPPLADADAALASLIVEAGAEPVVEHGVLVGEVQGLEVCRVVDGRLEVGVGKHDREVHRLVHADRPTAGALRAAVEVVRHERPVGLAEARRLRWTVVQRPELAGARRLEPVAPPLPRGDLREPAPAPAAGEDGDGAPVLVVCSTGIDVDLVPTATDARLADARADVRLVLLVPETDVHPVTAALASLLRPPAEVRTIRADWRTLA